ncbi:putative Ralf-like 34 [Tripterygium wilfordii]|uniref:Putative Ralf-like 34 n=1 Tax=Tripterygium wilfordii TaxID=458696 RepID=A0A7J7CQ10_TRIWF|nr:protein RALF-like 34 [Tripterygium wilfordii]KAF5736154.1 putative Ralf-like 34 [Tripterygium wilfordii]
MASFKSRSFTSILWLFLITILSGSPKIQAQVDESKLGLMTDALEWPFSMSLYSDLDNVDDLEFEDGVDVGDDDVVDRSRSLFWQRGRRYYISYGALSANRIPCPPRSGRSYYTHNCFKARGTAHPYTRGCSAITRCRR